MASNYQTQLIIGPHPYSSMPLHAGSGASSSNIPASSLSRTVGTAGIIPETTGSLATSTSTGSYHEMHAITFTGTKIIANRTSSFQGIVTIPDLSTMYQSSVALLPIASLFRTHMQSFGTRQIPSSYQQNTGSLLTAFTPYGSQVKQPYGGQNLQSQATVKQTSGSGNMLFNFNDLNWDFLNHSKRLQQRFRSHIFSSAG